MPPFAEDEWFLILLTISSIRLLVGNSTLQSKCPSVGRISLWVRRLEEGVRR